MSYDALFSPIQIRGLKLKNRVVLPGMCTKMMREKTYVDDNMIGYHVARAKGGCGLNTVEATSMCPEPQTHMYAGLYKEEHVRQFKRLTDAVHQVGGKIAVQLWHGGFNPQQFFNETNVLETPDTLSVERIHEIVDQFGRSAAMAVEAGFDAIEFHAAHSYLAHEFLSPGMNHRTDEYGGSVENRFRFGLEVIQSIRKNIPDTMPLIVRLDAVDELMDETMTQKEIVDFINAAADLGVDVASLSRGNGTSFATVYEVPTFNLPQGFNVENIYAIKQQVKIPVIGVGRINDPAMANQVIADGKFDLVAVGRAQIADPEWCNKAMRGEDETIRRCIACDQGCYDVVIDNNIPHITCTRNPMACLEYKGLPKTTSPKKVMIVGGGMAGITAAEVLKARGHEPVIYEATDQLTGQFLLAGAAPMKEEWLAAAKWEAAEVRKMGIEIHLNTTVTPELIEQVKPDELIIAVGSHYVAPNIPGIDGENVFNQYQVMSGEALPTGTVAVVGCGSVGTEVAEYLAERGAKVIAIEKKGVGNGMTMLRRMFQTPEFKRYGIQSMGGTTVTAIEPGLVHYFSIDRRTKAKTEGTLPCDSVVICTGITARNSDALQAKGRELGIPVHVIGDAKQARDLRVATGEGYQVGMDIV